MSRKCSITGKGLLRGHKVSHANNKSLKCWKANLKYKRLYDTETGQWVRLKVSSRVLRTIDRKGLSATLRDHGLSLAEMLA